MPKISVIIPTFNRPDGLRRVLESISNQTFRDFELLIVEDGSKVAEPVAKSFQKLIPSLRYFWQPNSGPAKARNKGIMEAKAELIAFTDDDMKLPSDWLEKLVDGFKRYPEVVGVGGYMKAPDEIFTKNKFAQYEWFVSHDVYHADTKERVGGFENPAGGTNNLAFKKKVLEEVGGFDENFPVPAGEDADLKKRITEKGNKLLYIPLQADHYQPYGLVRFIRQSYVRGIGTYYFVTKHEGILRQRTIFMRFMVIPINLLKDIIDSKRRSYAWIRALENFYIACGLLQASKGKK